ncbi:hypothetical protein N7E81_14950 [Reichenbachiella carrageenanivorans]|uniref:Uncharacterized protein n=1 Tax=Reichenbachiella carrageenanivorans TaxID=2979869 RepID=A0ABY6CXK6_9BACT|nr:hypothetical protein [Reichenbachiella carrageenanivorans]UXX78657.1 hypothetical protein N7E81_14950 [Reichenbachiella carrageenanivorans]
MKQNDNTIVYQADDTIHPAIEVFRTNITNEQMANEVLERLAAIWPALKINFDLDDCDNILRVESLQGGIEVLEITQVVESFHHIIEILE